MYVHTLCAQRPEGWSPGRLPGTVSGVGMVLKERKQVFCQELSQKIREGIVAEDSGQEISRFCFGRHKGTKVPGLMFSKNMEPPVKELWRYAEGITETPDSL